MGSRVKGSCSKSMGELLLGGWTMLAEVCTDCKVPLMRNPEDHTCLCVNCDAQYKDGVRIDAPPPSTAPTPQDGIPAPSTVQQPPPLAPDGPGSGKSSEAIADEIGSRLLQGWALLDVSCPVCNTPLVRDKPTKRMFCCGCDVWVLTEQQAAAQATAQPAPTPPQPAPTTSLAPIPPSPKVDVPSQQPASRAAHVPGTPADTQYRSPIPPGSTSRGAVLDRMEQSLLARLLEVEGLLGSISVLPGTSVGLLSSRLNELDGVVKVAGSCLALLKQIDETKSAS